MAPERAERLLRFSVALVWLCTGLFVLSPFYRAEGATFLQPLGLPWWTMVPTCVGEVALALWVFSRPTTLVSAVLQTAPVVFFTLVLSVTAPRLLVHPYGVLTKNLPLLAVLWTSYFVAIEGFSARAMRLLRVGIAVIWCTEGLFPKQIFQHPLELSLLTHWGLSDAMASLVVHVTGAAQLVACALVLWLEGPLRRYLLWALFVGLLVLPLIVLSQQPEMLFHPFGPMTKNLPILAGTWVLLQRCTSTPS